MKVLILSYYSGYVERGVEVWAESLKRSLKDECNIIILGSKKNPNNDTGTRNSLLSTFFLDSVSLSIAAFTFLNLYKVITGNFDIVIPTNGGWQTFIIRVVTFLTAKKMVIVGHSGIGRDDKWNCYCFPDCFVSLSTEAKNWAHKVNPLINTQYIPNGVHIDEFSPVGKKENITLQKPIYLFVGALERSKRPALAIEAVSRLERGSLLILGEGKLNTDILELGSTLLGSRFLMTKVRHEDIAAFYRAADVFTLPTWEHEAFGIVYLEALASGLPVVTTDDSIKREIIGDAGIFVNPTDLQSYSNALKLASISKWGVKPINQAKKFSWDLVGKKYLQLFKSL